MGLNAKPTSQENYENPFTKTSYLGRIAQIIDLGQQPQKDWQTGAEKDPLYEVMVTVEFPEVVNDEGMPKWLSKRYNFPYAWPKKAGISKKSNLFKLMNTFYPDLMTESEHFPAYSYFHPTIWSKLLDTEVFVEVGQTSGGRPKIVNLSRVPDFGNPIDVPALATPPLLFDIDTATVDQWLSLYKWLRKDLLNALDEDTRKAAQNLEDQVPPEDQLKKREEEDKPAVKPGKAKKAKGPAQQADSGAFDDDIPF
ncbi:MAG: hypothetical protein H3Z50_08025 [archaeon]|nr:hypothetical protein [archaeon]